MRTRIFPCWIALYFTAVTGSLAESIRQVDREDNSQIVQELLLGETPFLQNIGEFQVTLGSSYLSGNTEKLAAGFLSIEYGINENLQANVEVPYLKRMSREDNGEEDAKGFGGAVVGLRYAVLNQEKIVISAAFDLSIPTSNKDEGLENDSFSFEPSVNFGVAIGKAWAFGGIGAEAAREGASYNYTAATAYPISDKLVAIFESTGSFGENKYNYFTAGVAWRISEQYEAYFGVPLGLGGDAANWGLVGKVLFEF